MRWRGDSADITFGRQILPWGRADKINPTDVLGGRDITRMIFDDDDQRLGGLMLSLDRAIDHGLRLSARWLPETRPNRLPFRVPGFALDEYSSLFDLRQFALKLDHSGGEVDWSLS